MNISTPPIPEDDLDPLEEQSPDEGDGWFDPWLIAKGAPLSTLVDRTKKAIAFHEGQVAPRARARKGDAGKRFDESLEVLVCNLAYAVLNPLPNQWLAVSRSHAKAQTRYDNHSLSPKVFPELLDLCESRDILQQIRGDRKRRELTVISPSEWFERRLSELGVSMGDFGRSENEEVIILTLKEKRQTAGRAPKKTSELIDYKDTSASQRFREEIRSLNAFLREQDITFITDGGPPVDPFRRTLRRRFSLLAGDDVRFDQTGRMFGPFWMNLKKDRRKHIRIQGEQVQRLDFKNLFPRLAYASLGLEAPQDDLYDLTGLLKGYESTHHRSGVKKAFNSFLNGGANIDLDTKKKLPAGATGPKVQKALEEKHPALGRLLGSPIDDKLGYKLMFQESEILLRVLKGLQERGVVGLGLHDEVMVPRSKASLAQDLMTKASVEIVGHALPVEMEDLG